MYFHSLIKVHRIIHVSVWIQTNTRVRVSTNYLIQNSLAYTEAGCIVFFSKLIFTIQFIYTLDTGHNTMLENVICFGKHKYKNLTSYNFTLIVSKVRYIHSTTKKNYNKTCSSYVFVTNRREFRILLTLIYLNYFWLWDAFTLIIKYYLINTLKLTKALKNYSFHVNYWKSSLQ